MNQGFESMRVVFMGTGEIGLPTQRRLIAEEAFEVVGVVTQPDKPVGRKQLLTAPEVKTVALGHGIPVQQPERLRAAAAKDALRAWSPDVIVVMAYGQILPRAVLDLPKVACLNLHASLLPRHRGASPIQAAIREGDQESGITVMYMAPGLDTGDVLLQHSFLLDPKETGGSLHDRLAERAPAALMEALALLREGRAPREPQDESRATYSGKLGRDDGRLDWTQPAENLQRLIRAYDPWPGTFTSVAQGDRRLRVKIFPPVETGPEVGGSPGTMELQADGRWVIATGAGGLVLSEVQPEGKRRMEVRSFAQGYEKASGLRLECST